MLGSNLSFYSVHGEKIKIKKMKTLHAHLYLDDQELVRGQRLENLAFQHAHISFVKLYAKAVGPHPRAMVELHFYDLSLSVVREWLEQNRGESSVLIHEENGDDVLDHVENIEWLGDALPLDFGFFELIKLHPEMKIHP